MSLRGHVVAVIAETLGSKLVEDAAVGEQTLAVEYAGDFDDAGTLELNDARLEFVSWTSSEVEDDPDYLLLAAPLAVAATEGDVVAVVSGGATASDVVARVTLGDGDAVDVTIPFEQRPLWPIGDYDPPVPVEVSDDLMRIESVPYREAVVQGSASGIRFRNTDTFTAPGPGDLDCRLTYVPIDGSEDVVWGVPQPASEWTRDGANFTLLDPDNMIQAGQQVEVSYAYDGTAATPAWQLVETLEVSAKAASTGSGGVQSEAILEAGRTYQLVVDGTIAQWPDNPMPYGSHEPIKYLAAGETSRDASHDSEFVFASQNSGVYPQAQSNVLQWNLGGGWEHGAPEGGAPATMAPDHVYTYLIAGVGSVLSAGVFDINYTDNAGVFKMSIYEWRP